MSEIVSSAFIGAGIGVIAGVIVGGGPIAGVGALSGLMIGSVAEAFEKSVENRCYNNSAGRIACYVAGFFASIGLTMGIGAILGSPLSFASACIFTATALGIAAVCAFTISVLVVHIFSVILEICIAGGQKNR